MSRRDGTLFIGRLSKHTRTRDVEDIFKRYGRMSRCEVKYGAEMGYAFVDFEDKRDAEDAMKYENGRDIQGCSIIVEWAKGNPRRGGESRGGGGRSGGRDDECYKCGKLGHWARDCPDENRSGYRRQSGGNRHSPDRRRRSRSRSRDRKSRSRSYSLDRRSGSKSPRGRSDSKNGDRSRSRS